MLINKDNFVKILNKRGMSLNSLAKRMCCSRTHLSNVVNGRNKVTKQFVIRIVNILGDVEPDGFINK